MPGEPLSGLSFNRQSIFDSLRRTLVLSGDIELVSPDQYTGQFHLIDSVPPESSSQPLDLASANSSFTPSIIDMTVPSSSVPSMGQLYATERSVPIHTVPLEELLPQSASLQWLHNQMKRFGTRNLIISSLVASCFLLFLCFIIIRFHCTTRSSSRRHL